MKKTATKTGMLAVALAKVRALKADHKLLTDNLTEALQRNIGLRQANQKFAEDNHEFRLESIKVQNRLTNDNLHQADEIDRLKTYSVAQSEEIGRLNVCMVVGQQQVDGLQERIRFLREDADRLRQLHDQHLVNQKPARRNLAKLFAARIAACNKSPGPSTLSKVWKWLTLQR